MRSRPSATRSRLRAESSGRGDGLPRAPSSFPPRSRSRFPAGPTRLRLLRRLLPSIHQRRLHRGLARLADHGNQFVSLAPPLLFGQEIPVVLHVDLLLFAPGLLMETAHVELPGFDADLGS